MGRVHLEGQIFIIDGFTRASAALDGAINVVAGHVRSAAFQQNHAQAGIHGGITASQLGRDGDFLAQFCKNLAAFGVDGAFKMFNFGPLAMS